MSDTYSKGVNFEKFVAELFRRAGFLVEHNVVLKGRSGVEHQIDVLVSYRTPVTTFKALVECKNWFKPINKDVVMKVYNEVQDLGLDKGIIVTQSYATPEAVAYATSVGVEIIDGSKLKELSSKLKLVKAGEFKEELVEYLIPKEECIERCSSYGECVVKYYPIYELTLTRREIVRKGIFHRKEYVTRRKEVLLVDAVHGFCVLLDRKRGLEFHKALYLTITDEEAKVYRYVASLGMANVDQVASGLGISTAKARRILESLVGAGLMGRERVNRRRYYVALSLGMKVYREGRELEKLYEEVLRVSGEKPVEGEEVSARVPVNAVIRYLTKLTDYKVVRHKIFYYPLIMVKSREGVEVWDAYTCGKFKHLDKVAAIMPS